MLARRIWPEAHPYTPARERLLDLGTPKLVNDLL
jgi:hypothetical protein